MKNLIKLLFTIIFAIVLFTACSSEDNPISPTDPGNGGGNEDPTIKTPKYMKITSITVTRFPGTKSNGDKWDYHVFPNSPTRRPDLMVELSKSGSSLYVYRSDTKEDAILETVYDSYVFTQSASSNSGSLPYSVSINQTFTIDLMDDDGLTANDWMGSVSINAAVYYNNDNATHVYKTLTSGGITIKIEGRWVY